MKRTENSRYANLYYLSGILSASIASVSLKPETLQIWKNVSELIEKILEDPSYEPSTEEYAQLNKTKSELIMLQEVLIKRSTSLPDSIRSIVNSERMKIRQELECMPDFKPMEMRCIGKVIRESRTGTERSKIVPPGETSTNEHVRERGFYRGGRSR